jgi:hypothetical protein
VPADAGQGTLPVHSRDICPWGATCSVHARQTFADEVGRKKTGRPLKPCVKCASARLEALADRRGRPLCADCKEANRRLDFAGRPPLFLSKDYRSARGVLA